MKHLVLALLLSFFVRSYAKDKTTYQFRQFNLHGYVQLITEKFCSKERIDKSNCKVFRVTSFSKDARRATLESHFGNISKIVTYQYNNQFDDFLRREDSSESLSGIYKFSEAKLLPNGRAETIAAYNRKGELDKSISFEYDDLGNCTAVFEIENGIVPKKEPILKMEYEQHRLIKVDNLGLVTVLHYDDKGYLIEQKMPRSRILYKNDDKGNWIERQTISDDTGKLTSFHIREITYYK